MRHARGGNRLSRPSEHRQALLDNLARAVLTHGRIRTTLAKAKEAQRVVDRLITLGKDGSVHARRLAFQTLQDRALVKQLFAEVAPRFLDCHGGYTRIVKLTPRLGDGAPQVLFELTRLPTEGPKPRPAVKAKPAPAAPARPGPEQAPPAKPKRFFESLRGLLRPKKWGRES